MTRWRKTLGLDLVKRLVFLPTVAQSEMMTITAQCDVMLDTFPWGAGVTSLEALYAGTPIVTLPSRLSVLQLAAGQVGTSCLWFLRRVACRVHDSARSSRNEERHNV